MTVRGLPASCIARACCESRHAADWPANVKVAVNLSPIQLLSANLTAVVINALAHSKLSPERLELEITEAVLLENTESIPSIELVDLTTGRQRTLRAARRDAAFFYPSLFGSRLLFERVTRCVQQLRVAPLSRRNGRMLLGLSSTVTRDPGYQAGYTHAYNSASGCGIRSRLSCACILRSRAPRWAGRA